MKMTEMKICLHRHSFKEPLLKTKEQHNSEFVSRICESLTNYGEFGAILVSISFIGPFESRAKFPVEKFNNFFHKPIR